MKYDLIIVGSGSVGSAAGYYATKAGLKVLMTDSYHPPHSEGSHHGRSRIIRYAYAEGDLYVPLVLRAKALWDEFEEVSKTKLFERTGILNFGPPESNFIKNVNICSQKYNLSLECLSAKELMQRWPEIHVPENYLGLYEPDTGFLNSELAISTYIRLAREEGCVQKFNCPVIKFHSDSDGVKIETEEGVFEGKKMLLSAGTWVTRLIPDLPVKPIRMVFAWFKADRRFSAKNGFPVLLGEINKDIFYSFPAENGEFKFSKHNGGHEISNPTERTPYGSVASDKESIIPHLRRLLPDVGEVIRGASCTYDMSPDEDFIVDVLPGCPNVLMVTGLSGHGFKFAPVFGNIATQFAQDMPLEFDIKPFSLTRFVKKNSLLARSHL